MKALTICQPYATLICLPESDPRHKRVENRKWPCSYRGELLIHAGKSRDYLAGDNYGFDVEDMPFGAIVAIAILVDCFHVVNRERRATQRPWLAMHSHVEGPYCFVLENVCPLKTPIACPGSLGLWHYSGEVVAD